MTRYHKMLILPLFLISSCSIMPNPQEGFIADYTVAKENVIRSIPSAYIDAARASLSVSYNHTSHGTHVSYGIFGLPDFKSGDGILFGITNDAAVRDPNKLDFHDIYGQDLSQADADWDAWIDTVRSFLDDPANADINVVMWSWCNIAGHSVPEYLSSMETVIGEYGKSGSKIGSGAGKTRSVPVTFVFMTGHANGGADNLGEGNPKEQAKLIVDYCRQNGYFCLDYYSIDTHSMEDVYYEDANDDAYSDTYGGNFYMDWQNSHTLGADWFENKTSPGGSVQYGEHNSQHITANRKAFALWWILARIAGWEG